MALHCPDCGAQNSQGTFYCGPCGCALLPEAMMPTDRRQSAVRVAGPPPAPAEPSAALGATSRVVAALIAEAGAPGVSREDPEGRFVSDQGETRYRIILGDTCPVCRGVSRISFTPDNPPQIPIAGCRESDDCRCTLPIFASDLDAALSSPQRSLSALAPARGGLSVVQPEIELRSVPLFGPGAKTPPELNVPSVVRGSRRKAPEWSMPAPITLRRRHDLVDLTALYYQRRIQGIRIQPAPGCCRVCTDVAASIYEPSVAPTLPIVGCWHGWQCGCHYAEEPLPLDLKGLEALRLLALQERERSLRRRRVARFAPRRFHQVVVALAVLVAIAALGQSVDPARSAVWEVIVPLLLAGVCAALAVGAIVRRRLLPPPQAIDVLCGLIVAGIGLHSAIRTWIPTGASLGNLNALGGTRVTVSLSGHALLSLSHAEQMLVAAGLALFLAGLVGLRIGAGYMGRRTAE